MIINENERTIKIDRGRRKQVEKKYTANETIEREKKKHKGRKFSIYKV